MTLVPTMGSQFIAETFVTVVTGGGDVFLGTAPAAVILGFIRASMTSWQGQLAGQIGLLVAVIVVIRVLPQGVSGSSCANGLSRMARRQFILRLTSRLEGPQTLGRGRWFWIGAVVVLAAPLPIRW